MSLDSRAASWSVARPLAWLDVMAPTWTVVRATMRAQAQITSALRLLGSGRISEHASALQCVLQVSALKADGIAPLWDAITAQRRTREASGAWGLKRREQSLAWMWERIQAGLRQAFVSHPGMAAQLEAMTAEVREGRTPASTAARQLLAAFRSPA